MVLGEWLCTSSQQKKVFPLIALIAYLEKTDPEY
jgi:hypothetical protein